MSASGVKAMRADSVARLTVALRTPGTLCSAFSTRPTQEAQVMPPIGISSVVVAAREAESRFMHKG